MASANVTLRGSRTFMRKNGQTWRKGETRMLTNPREIEYYKGQAVFTVDVLKEKPKPAPAPKGDEGGDDGAPNDGDQGDKKAAPASSKAKTKAKAKSDDVPV